MPTAEQHARIEIDRLLTAAGWSVQTFKQANIHPARGVALREFPLRACRHPRMTVATNDSLLIPCS